MDKVYIYGTGDYGMRLYDYYMGRGRVDVVGFIRTKAKLDESIEELRVLSLEEVGTVDEEDQIHIAVANRQIAEMIRMQLLNRGVALERILIMSSFIDENLPLNNPKCPVCGKVIAEFESGNGMLEKSILFEKHHVIGAGYREKLWCPNCRCNDRLRWLYYVLATKTDVFDGNRVINCLHFAPEPFVKALLKKEKKINYYPVDIIPSEDVNYCDIRNIPFQQNTFDYIIANHVLEHIDDEKRALNELRRVLKQNGKIVVSFPICVDIDTIEEDNKREHITSEVRLQKFGQRDHVRLYGRDYKSRFERYGFRVSVFSPERELKKTIIDKMGFSDDDIIIIIQ